jgi:hypothetical protein
MSLVPKTLDAIKAREVVRIVEGLSDASFRDGAPPYAHDGQVSAATLPVARDGFAGS